MILNYSTKVVKVKRETYYKIIIRTLFRAGSHSIYRFSTINAQQTVLGKAPTAYLQNNPYATHRVFTPKPTTSSQESLSNNPAVSLHRPKGDVVIQHPELVQQVCPKDNCKEYACQEPCDKTLTEETSIGILTHSTRMGGTVISDTDIDGVVSDQVLRTFEKPHKTTGESVNDVRDQKRTENLQKILIEAAND